VKLPQVGDQTYRKFLLTVYQPPQVKCPCFPPFRG